MTNISIDMQQRIDAAIEHLHSKNVSFDSGLSEDELDRVQKEFGRNFPPDLRYFLERGLPRGDRFPNWRTPDAGLRQQLLWPFEGFEFDILQSGYWRIAWGVPPDADADAVSFAMMLLAKAPPLVPIMGHSYLPSEPALEGNPVFSVYQTDVIHRGGDLAAYLFWIHHDEEKEDELEPLYPPFSPSYRHIEFWTDVASETPRRAQRSLQNAAKAL